MTDCFWRSRTFTVAAALPRLTLSLRIDGNGVRHDSDLRNENAGDRHALARFQREAEASSR